MISTQQIHYILQLSETKNFSKAADDCFVTQPTLSMQIKKAEEVLGFLIFDRDKNPIELTHLGNQLMPIIQELNYQNNLIIQLSKKASGTYIEELTIGVIPTISAYLIPMLYQKWRKIVPTTRLIIKESKTDDVIELLDNRKIDLAIIAGPILDLKWKTYDLYTEELLAYTQNKGSSVINMNDIVDEKPWLLSEGNCLRSQMMQFCKLNKRVEEDWSFEGGNIDLLIKMVDMNGGYTLVPKNYKLIQNNLKGSFHSIQDTGKKISPARSIIAIQSNRNNKSQSIRLIVKSIQDALKQPSKKEFSIVNWK